MNSTDVERPAPLDSVGLCSSKEGSCKAESSACGTSGCASSNHTAKAFFIPFLSVTAYSLYQGTSCAANGGHACTASAVAVGVLAGLTSVGLVKGIKALRKSRTSKIT